VNLNKVKSEVCIKLVLLATKLQQVCFPAVAYNLRLLPDSLYCLSRRHPGERTVVLTGNVCGSTLRMRPSLAKHGPKYSTINMQTACLNLI
jgi:hypothetical protein